MQENTLKVTLKFLKEEDVNCKLSSEDIRMAETVNFVAVFGIALPMIGAIYTADRPLQWAIGSAIWAVLLVLGAIVLEVSHRQSHFNRRYQLVKSGQYGPVLDQLLSFRAKLEERQGLTDEERKGYLAKADGVIMMVWVEAHQLLGLLEAQPDEAINTANALIAEVNGIDEAVAELEAYVQS